MSASSTASRTHSMTRGTKALLALVSCACLGAPVSAGVINLVAFNENPTSFTSTFEWLDVGGTWNANIHVIGQFWEVDMGAAGVGRPGGGNLWEDSRHLVNPPGHTDVAPNFWSSWNYPGASAGIGPVNTWFNHRGDNPTHVDVYSLSTAIIAPGAVLITFTGEHEGVPSGIYRVPAPGGIVSLSLLAITTSSRRRRM